MPKIKKCRKSENGMKLKVVRVVITGSLMLGILSLTGCDSQADVQFQIKSNTLNAVTGIIKNGDELIPFFETEFFTYDEYCSLKTGDFIGRKEDNDFSSVIVDDNYNVLFSNETQTIHFNECYFNGSLDYEVISNFDETIYQSYADNYLENVAQFNKPLINVYEMENLKNGKIKTIIGYQVSNTQFFNFETYMVEDYAGWNFNCILDGNTIEQENCSYNEILDILEQYKGDTLSLEID